MKTTLLLVAILMVHGLAATKAESKTELLEKLLDLLEETAENEQAKEVERSLESDFDEEKAQAAEYGNAFVEQKLHARGMPYSEDFDEDKSQGMPYDRAYGEDKAQDMPYDRAFDEDKLHEMPYGGEFGEDKSQGMPYDRAYGEDKLQDMPYGGEFGEDKSQGMPYDGENKLQDMPYEGEFGEDKSQGMPYDEDLMEERSLGHGNGLRDAFEAERSLENLQEPFLTARKLDMDREARSQRSLSCGSCSCTCSSGSLRQKYSPRSNGCGAVSMSDATRARFDDFGRCNFRSCCNTHDVCYGGCGSSKSGCDSAFLSCMKRASQRFSCGTVAQVYYLAVKWYGCNAYKAAQKSYCACS